MDKDWYQDAQKVLQHLAGLPQASNIDPPSMLPVFSAWIALVRANAPYCNLRMFQLQHRAEDLGFSTPFPPLETLHNVEPPRRRGAEQVRSLVLSVALWAMKGSAEHENVAVDALAESFSKEPVLTFLMLEWVWNWVRHQSQYPGPKTHQGIELLWDVAQFPPEVEQAFKSHRQALRPVYYQMMAPKKENQQP